MKTTKENGTVHIYTCIISVSNDSLLNFSWIQIIEACGGECHRELVKNKTDFLIAARAIGNNRNYKP